MSCVGFAWGEKQNKGRYGLETGEKPAREERGLEPVCTELRHFTWSSRKLPERLVAAPLQLFPHTCGFFVLWKLRQCGINKASSVPGLLHFWCIHRRKLYCLVFPDDYEVAEAWCAMLTSSYMLISRISPVIGKPLYKVRLAAFLKRKIILK